MSQLRWTEEQLANYRRKQGRTEYPDAGLGGQPAAGAPAKAPGSAVTQPRVDPGRRPDQLGSAAKATFVDGIRFPSKLEAAVYQRLKLRQQANNDPLVFFLRQVPFDLGGGTKAIWDFVLFEATEHGPGIFRVLVQDAKGFETDKFKRNKRQTEGLYPVEVDLVRR